MKKKFFLLFSVFFILNIIFSSLYIYKSNYFNLFNKQFIDIMFKIRGKTKKDKNIIIIDIDEKSLKKLGQWPWSRNIIAKILKNLTDAGVGIIGFDMVFAEKDKTSPQYIFKKFHINKKAPDYDKILAQEVASSPTILGYTFRFDNEIYSTLPPKIQGIFLEKNKPQEDFSPIAKSVILNIPVIQNSAYSSGFFNIFPDEDGIIRSAPLLIKFKHFIYPSLTLEIVRTILGANKVIIHYSNLGIKNIQINNLIIPTGPHGRLYLNYNGPKRMFNYISAIDIYENHFDKNLIKGKIALIGTSALGLLDIRATPFDSTFPGVEIQATILDNLINKTFLKKPSWIEGANLTIIILIIFFVTLAFIFPNIFTIFIFILLTTGILYFDYYMLFTKHYIFNIIFPIIASFTTFLILIVLHFFIEHRQKEKIKQKFAKKVSPQVVEELLKSIDSNTFEIREKEITIFFSDIRTFTTISEQIQSPKRLIVLLNKYFTPMTEIIINTKGTVDKFIGDAIMAYWNAPNNIPNHADKAVKSAIQQIKELNELNQYLEKENFPSIHIGIGINTGKAIIGEMGSEGRSDYTAIGDSVNLTSRLEGLNKYYGTNIIISEFTYKQLKDSYNIRELDLVKVKGKKEAVKIYEILTKKLEENELSYYNTALKHYKNAEFEKAKKIFIELWNENKLKLYKIYIKRCENLIKNPPKKFKGVYEFTTK